MKMSFMSACIKFFGLNTKPDGTEQTKLEFGKEVKALTEQDRLDLKPGLEAALGCEIEMAQQ